MSPLLPNTSEEIERLTIFRASDHVLEAASKEEIAEVARVLAANALKLRGDDEMVLDMIGYCDRERLEPDQLRRVLVSLVERIELDPKTRQFNIRYRLPVTDTGVKVATPRGIEPLLLP